MNMHELRREYLQGGLRRKDLESCPVQQFHHWFQQILSCDVPDPNAMVLATLQADGTLRQRIVLLKEVSQGGDFLFYTNQESDKGRALTAHPIASVLFPWVVLERQVQISGRVEPLRDAEASAYFASRPRESQIAAWVSAQSRPVASRDDLESRFADYSAKFEQSDIPKPPHWGGYRVIPDCIEFWQGGAHRLHDRFRYTRAADGQWTITRLQP
jgi:pyridoxamine 5'-phosphate oxidase